ncbi:MAG: hypothetical protein V3T30_06040 [Thermodesulfobacteriota bacterium]
MKATRCRRGGRFFKRATFVVLVAGAVVGLSLLFGAGRGFATLDTRSAIVKELGLSAEQTVLLGEVEEELRLLREVRKSTHAGLKKLAANGKLDEASLKGFASETGEEIATGTNAAIEKFVAFNAALDTEQRAELAEMLIKHQDGKLDGRWFGRAH